MFRKKEDHSVDARLDRVGRAVVRAASMGDEEIERVASSPFLAARLRARIDAARAAKEESGDWLAVFGVAWRAVPAMSLAAALAVGVFFFVAGGGDPFPAGILTDEALLATSESAVEGVFFDETGALTQDEVLSAIVDENERRTQR